MNLKRPEQIEWLELPRIESPDLARSWVESNLSIDGFGCPVDGLHDVLSDDFGSMACSLDEFSYARLLERLENCEVFLVHALGRQPMRPVVRPEQGADGEWAIDSSLDLDAQNRLEWMLAYARQTRDIRQPRKQPDAAQPSKAKPKKEKKSLEVTNPRWEHADGKRGQDSPDTARAGDTVVLMVDVDGAADGTVVTFKIVDTSISPPGRVGSVRGKVEGGQGKAEWTLKVPRAGTKLEFEGQVRRVGSGPARIPVKNEVAVRVGVFFDGTGNNMLHDLPKGTDTNIVRLYELYNTNPGQEDKKPVGDQDSLALYTNKIYRNGVGTDDGQEDSTYGLATGAEGVSRIESALADLREFLGKFAGQEGPRTVDVFGFSRGAALARDFVNQVNKELGEDGVRVGFVGIFDTVASFGLGGNNVNFRSDDPLATGAAASLGLGGALLTRLIFGEFQLDLGPESARRVVHVTSADEIRHNFPLSSLRPSPDAEPPSNMEEVKVVGVHSDVGGGYGTHETEELDRIEKRVIRYQTLGPAAQWQPRLMAQKRELEEEAQRRGLEVVYEDSTSNAVGESTDTYWLARRRTVKPGLSNVYLHFMHEKAKSEEVPLLRLDEFIAREPERFAIAQELQSLFASDNHTAEDPEAIRREYVHTSYRDWEDADEEHSWIAHFAEPDGVRNIYYNDPDEAVVPETAETGQSTQQEQMEFMGP